MAGFGGRAAVRAIAAALLCALALPTLAQSVTTSPGPDAVAVTIYRNPQRSGGEAMNLAWLDGYALITERRRVAIPAGEGDIRFEGVAGGIVPESAIVTGLPDGVVEKNQDAYLLSPASLLDRTLGKRVHLRRTSRETGAVREQEAVVRTGAGGAVVLQTAEGYEALRCTGLAETIVYPGVPEGLSARPTLSVRTRSARAASATVTLSYLATGFDWQANYVATLSPAGDRISLFAWVTLANGDETSFVDAETQTVAGRPNRQGGGGRELASEGGLHLQCWPAGTTSDIAPERDFGDAGTPPAPPPPPMMAIAEEAIVVTAARSVNMVEQEELGDLKLYRVPQPVTVASNSQKQVALLDRGSVKVESFYRASISPSAEAQLFRPVRILKTRNRKEEGLGLPLPAGGVVLFGAGRARPVLIGEGSIDDRAIGEDVEIRLGEAAGVIARVTRTANSDKVAEYDLTVSNDQPRPVRFEAEFGTAAEEVFEPATRARLGRRNGRPLWSVMVPANGTASLRYRMKRAS